MSIVKDQSFNFSSIGHVEADYPSVVDRLVRVEHQATTNFYINVRTRGRILELSGDDLPYHRKERTPKNRANK